MGVTQRGWRGRDIDIDGGGGGLGPLRRGVPLAVVRLTTLCRGTGGIFRIDIGMAGLGHVLGDEVVRLTPSLILD